MDVISIELADNMFINDIEELIKEKLDYKFKDIKGVIQRYNEIFYNISFEDSCKRILIDKEKFVEYVYINYIDGDILNTNKTYTIKCVRYVLENNNINISDDIIESLLYHFYSDKNLIYSISYSCLEFLKSNENFLTMFDIIVDVEHTIRDYYNLDFNIIDIYNLLKEYGVDYMNLNKNEIIDFIYNKYNFNDMYTSIRLSLHEYYRFLKLNFRENILFDEDIYNIFNMKPSSVRNYLDNYSDFDFKNDISVITMTAPYYIDFIFKTEDNLTNNRIIQQIISIMTSKLSNSLNKIKYKSEDFNKRPIIITNNVIMNDKLSIIKNMIKTYDNTLRANIISYIKDVHGIKHSEIVSYSTKNLISYYGIDMNIYEQYSRMMSGAIKSYKNKINVGYFKSRINEPELISLILKAFG